MEADSDGFGPLNPFPSSLEPVGGRPLISARREPQERSEFVSSRALLGVDPPHNLADEGTIATQSPLARCLRSPW